jgi:hypothetical protein
MIVINNGDVYLLDCIKMTLHNDGAIKAAMIQGKVPEYSSIDLKKERMLAISEGGEGRLCKVLRNTDFSDCLSPGKSRKEYLIEAYPEDFRVISSSALVSITHLIK